jgi:hypothetical protein
MLGRTPPSKKPVVRYNVIYYDCEWTELPERTRTYLTAAEMEDLIVEFNQMHQQFNRSGDVVFPASDFPFFINIGVEYVEV